MPNHQTVVAAEFALQRCKEAYEAVVATEDPHPQILDCLANAANIAGAELDETRCELAETALTLRNLPDDGCLS